MKSATASRLFLAAALSMSLAACNAPSSEAPVQASAQGDRTRLDSERGRVWLLDANGVVLHERGARQGRPIALPDWTWVGAEYACFPDLALGPRGEVVVTSNIVPVVWRIDPDTLRVSVHPVALKADNDKDVGFSSLVYSAERNAYVATSDLHGSVWEIDGALASAQKIASSEQARGDCGLTVRGRIAQLRAKRMLSLAGVYK